MGTLSPYRAIMSFSHVIFAAFLLTFFVVAAIKETEESDSVGEPVMLKEQESDSTGELVPLKEQGTQQNEGYLESQLKTNNATDVIEQLQKNFKKLQENFKKMQGDLEALRRSQKETDKRQILCEMGWDTSGVGGIFISHVKSYPSVTIMPYYRDFKFNPTKTFVDQIYKKKDGTWRVGVSNPGGQNYVVYFCGL